MINEEEAIKAELRPILSAYFDVEEEVSGRFLIDNTPVRIDFLLRPRSHLIDLGIAPDWFGLEVKSPLGKDSKKKGLQVTWQALTYAQSQFGDRRPAFVAIYPPIWEFFPVAKVLNKRTSRHYDFNEAHWLKCFLQKANVGSFVVLLGPGKPDWRIEVGAGGTLFSRNGPSAIKSVGIRRVVGTWK